MKPQGVRAISASQNRSGGASPLSRFASQPKALLTIAARHHKLIAALAMVAIWVGTFHAIGRL